MNQELKYCKFCDKEKPIKEFCKSGGAIKNICRECQNKKQKKQYRDAKILTKLEEWLKEEIKKLEINIQFEREQTFLIQYHIYGHCLDKITELKEKYK